MVVAVGIAGGVGASSAVAFEGGAFPEEYMLADVVLDWDLPYGYGVRAMHHGVGPRAGKFYESLGVQPTRLVRTPEGWRIAHHEWHATVKLGSLDDLFAPEIAAGKKH